MSFAAALILIAQSAAPAPVATATPVRAAPVAEQVTATVRVLAPARISAVVEAPASEQANAPARSIQRSRDTAGTIWIEFS